MIPFHRPSIGAAERAAALDVLASGWLTSGPLVEAFEAAMASYLGVRHAVAVNSGTAALRLALDGITGDVVVPTYTFAACGEVVIQAGCRVVLADVDEDGLLGPDQLAAAVTPQTRAVMPVHFAGRLVDIGALGTTARMIVDAAHCLPIAGHLGDVAALSFYATKTLTTGEGGMLVTNDDDLAERARIMRLHGLSREAWSRYSGGSWRYSILAAGFKDNMTDIAAALGLVQFERMAELHAKRARIAARYDAAFGPSRPSSSWHLYVLRTADRDEVIRRLTAAGIGSSVHFIPLHLHPLYRTMGYRPGDFPVAERLFRESVSLPIYPDMTDDEVDRVIETVALVAA